MQRPIAGAFMTLFENLQQDDKKFFNYFRMSSFDELLSGKSQSLVKEGTKMKDEISPTEQ